MHASRSQRRSGSQRARASGPAWPSRAPNRNRTCQASGLKNQLPPPEPELEVPELIGDPTFENYIGLLFVDKCIGCHDESESAPMGLDLSSYSSVMRGSDNGPVISVGNAENSVLVQVQSGDHFANFTAEELDNIINWINNNAPKE